MQILIVAATEMEISPLLNFLDKEFDKGDSSFHYYRNECSIHILITGIGLVATAYHLGVYLSTFSFDLVINAGIAGSYKQDINIGDVAWVKEDQLAEFGVEEANGNFTSVFDMGLMDKNSFPFTNQKLISPKTEQHQHLEVVTGLTVQRVHGFAPSIAVAKKRYNADIETMESAAFFFACLSHQVPFQAIRAISNFVEPRNRANWNIPLAINNLNQYLIQFIEDSQN